MDNFYVWPDNNIIRQRFIANKIPTFKNSCNSVLFKHFWKDSLKDKNNSPI